jgi:hypothetical protein
MVKTQEKKAAKAKPAKLKGDLIASGGARKSGSKRAGAAQGTEDSGSGIGDAFLHFLQSPLVADLLAVAATAALAALAEQRFSSPGSGKKKAAGKAVKAAGVAAAAAIGRRLTEEIDEIKKASKARQEPAA